MRKNFLILGILLVMICVAGCGALYGKKSQYDDGDWYLFAGSSEVARIEQDKLALAKLKMQPVQTTIIQGTSQGYKGLVANLDRHCNYNFIISGIEKRGYLLEPNNTTTDFLVAGTYS